MVCWTCNSCPWIAEDLGLSGLKKMYGIIAKCLGCSLPD